MDRFKTRALFFLMALLAAGCDSPADAVDAATPPLDANADAGAISDAGPDAGPVDAGPPPPGVAIATQVCVPASLALDSDTSHVAFVSCAGAAPALLVQPIAGGDAAALGPAASTTPIWFAPDDAHLAWRSESGVTLRDVAAARAATPVGLGEIEDLRFATQASSGQLRLLALDRRAPSSAELLAYDRNAGGDYDAPRALVSGAPIRGDLELITSGAVNVLYEVEIGGGDARYGMAQLDGAISALTLDVDPNTFVMGVIGLGNTHGIARRGEGLVFVQFSDASVVELSASGLPAGDDYPLFVVDDASMNRYAYFLVDGDPSRRLRNGSGPLETLASGTGTGLALSPESDRLYFIAGTELHAVTLDGVTETTVMSGLSTPPSFAVAISSDGALVAALGGGASVRRASADGSGEVELEVGGVEAGSIGWNGDDSALFWIQDGLLRTAGATETSANSVATGVVGWWPLAGSAAIVYLTGDGTLRRLD